MAILMTRRAQVAWLLAQGAEVAPWATSAQVICRRPTQKLVLANL